MPRAQVALVAMCVQDLLCGCTPFTRDVPLRAVGKVWPSPSRRAGGYVSRSDRAGLTRSQMVFDFFTERAREGLEQLENIASKTLEGKLGEALGEAGEYTKATVSHTSERFYDGLAKSRNPLVQGLDALLGGDLRLRDTIDSLEEVLLSADIGSSTTADILRDLETVARTDQLDPDDVKSVLRARLVQVLEGRGGASLASEVLLPPEVTGPQQRDQNVTSWTGGANHSGAGVADEVVRVVDDASRRRWQALTFSGSPATAGDGSLHPSLTVFLVIGANGMGKTTTVGKLAKRLKDEGRQRVMVAACDTFRAAAVEQLEVWAERAGVVAFVKPLEPSSAQAPGEAESATTITAGSSFAPKKGKKEAASTVLYRAIDEAVALGVDTLIVDTAGRLANNYELNNELRKLRRVIETRLGRPPHETLLVVDAGIGRNALDQAEIWRDEVGVTGVVVTKLDGTARAGYVVGLVRDLGLPVKLVGVGEGLGDLKDFDPRAFVDALLGHDAERARLLERRLEGILEADRRTRMLPGQGQVKGTVRGARGAASGAGGFMDMARSLFSPGDMQDPARGGLQGLSSTDKSGGASKSSASGSARKLNTKKKKKKKKL